MRNKYSLADTVNVLVYNAIAGAVHCTAIQLVADSVSNDVWLDVNTLVKLPVSNSSIGVRAFWEHVREKTK